MAMNLGSGGGNGDPEVMMDINTTPLIDVMLVLIIMLIITIPVQLHSVNLNMPAGNPPPPLKEPVVVTIDVDFDGTILWNGETLADARRARSQIARGCDPARSAGGACAAEQTGRVQVRGRGVGRIPAARHFQARHGRQRTVRQVIAGRDRTSEFSRLLLSMTTSFLRRPARLLVGIAATLALGLATHSRPERKGCGPRSAGRCRPHRS